MLGKLTHAWKEYLGNNRLNLSCKIVLTAAAADQLLDVSEEEEARINKVLDVFARKYQMLKVSTLKGVGEYNIKIIALDVYTSKTDVVEDLRAALTKLVTELLIEQGLALQLKGTGSFSTRKEKENFIYENNGQIVEYKITGTGKVSLFWRLFCRSVRMYLLIILVIVILIWQEWLIYRW